MNAENLESIGLRIFDSKVFGESLKEISRDTISTSVAKIYCRYFQGSSEIDLYLWFDSHENFIRIQVSYFGQVVEWNVLDGIKTGTVVEEETESGDLEKPSVHYDEIPQETTIRQASQMIQHVPGLFDHEKEKIIESLQADKESLVSARKFLTLYSNQPKIVRLWYKLTGWLKSLFSCH